MRGNLPNQDNNWIGQNGQKMQNLTWPYWKNYEKLKEFKKGQKLQAWSQKSPSGSTAGYSAQLVGYTGISMLQ